MALCCEKPESFGNSPFCKTGAEWTTYVRGARCVGYEPWIPKWLVVVRRAAGYLRMTNGKRLLIENISDQIIAIVTIP